MNPNEPETYYGVEVPQEPTEKKTEEVKPRFQWGSFAKAMFFPVLNLIFVIILCVINHTQKNELKQFKQEAYERGYGWFSGPDGSFEWSNK